MSYKFLPINQTNLGLWQACPKKFEYEKLSPKVPFEDTPAVIFGRRLHSAMEHAIKDGTPLPAEFNGSLPDMEHERVNMTPYLSMVQGLAAVGATIKVEQSLAIDKLGRATHAKDWNNRFITGKDDCTAFKGHRAVSYDWKTGKYSVEFRGEVQEGWDQQLRLQAELTYTAYPEVMEHTGFLVFVVAKRISPPCKTVRGAAFTQKMVDDIGHYVEAFSTANYPPRKNNLCSRYCPVTSCPHNGGYKG